MRRFSNSLDNVSVAAPCPADWDSMIGSDRVRFCSQCQLNVYNLSAMSKYEAESLISRTEGRLCVRFYRRRDGSILTENCPVGLRALKRRAARIKRAVASSVLSFLAGIGANAVVNRVGNYLVEWLAPSPAYGHTLGVMAEPRKEIDVAHVGEFTVDERQPRFQGRLVLKPPIDKPRSQSKQTQRR